jgi:hypothetical protein
VVDALIEASAPDPAIESHGVGNELAKLMKTAAVITVTAKGQIEVLDDFKRAPGLCLTLLAEKACVHAQRTIAKSST